MSDSRLKYIDAIRGFTIILVVYSHVMFFIALDTKELINSYFIRFRMPLFFFISGFFVYSPNYTFEHLIRRTRNRLLRQLYPTIVICLLFILTLYRHSARHLLYDPGKGGYWFTLVAVEIFLVIAPLLFLMNSAKFSNAKKAISLFLVIAAIVGLDYFKGTSLYNQEIVKLLSFRRILHFTPFFIGGIIFRIYEKTLSVILANTYTFVVALLLFFWSREFITEPMFYALVEGFSGIIIVYYLFINIYRLKAVEDSKASQWLQHVGKNTLEIYLIHYFFVFTLAKLPQLKSLGQIDSVTLKFLTIISIAAVITASTLLVAYLLRKLRIYKFLFAKE